MVEEEDYSDDDDGDEPTLFLLKGVLVSTTTYDLEQTIASVLELNITILEETNNNNNDEDTDHDHCGGSILFMVSNENKDNVVSDDEMILQKFQKYILKVQEEEEEEEGCHRGFWLDPTQAKIIKAEMEEEILVSEEEAYDLWLNNNNNNNNDNNNNDDDDESSLRTSHLDLVPSPDGNLIQPSHNNNNNNTNQQQQEQSSPIQDQLQRDPTLLEFDNVPRIHISEIILDNKERSHSLLSWTQPVVIVGFFSQQEEEKQLLQNVQQKLSLNNLINKYGNVIVRTGNRETLTEHGFNHSKPQSLKDALSQPPEDTSTSSANNSNSNCMVFSPIKELEETLQNDVLKWITTTTTTQENNNNTNIFQQVLYDPINYTLCLKSRQGFGIGMHKHGPAMFCLVEGRKKWYMSSSSTSLSTTEEEKSTTHPEFYTTKSSHKCIQQPGEILFVPNQWYHEIFNLDEYTAGIQALADGTIRMRV